MSEPRRSARLAATATTTETATDAAAVSEVIIYQVLLNTSSRPWNLLLLQHLRLLTLGIVYPRTS
jgi:hypothetical protein